MDMLTDKDEKWWKIGVWGLSLFSVPLILIIYHLFIWIHGEPLFPAINAKNIPTILSIITSFSITMTGFIAAIGAYLLSVSRTPTFSEWRNNGYLSVFFNLYGAAIVCLLITFATCLLMMLSVMTMWWLKIIISLVILNLAHIILITGIVVNLAKVQDE